MSTSGHDLPDLLQAEEYTYTAKRDVTDKQGPGRHGALAVALDRRWTLCSAAILAQGKHKDEAKTSMILHTVCNILFAGPDTVSGGLCLRQGT